LGYRGGTGEVTGTESGPTQPKKEMEETKIFSTVESEKGSERGGGEGEGGPL